jgi:hypothetical protein
VISLTAIGILGLLTLFVLLALRMPVALSMLFIGFTGTIIANAIKFISIGMGSDQAWARGWKIAYSNLAGETFEAASNYNLLVIREVALLQQLLRLARALRHFQGLRWLLPSRWDVWRCLR